MFVCEITSGGQKKKKKYIYKYLFVFRLAFWCTALSRFLVVAVAVFFFFIVSLSLDSQKKKEKTALLAKSARRLPRRKNKEVGRKKKVKDLTRSSAQFSILRQVTQGKKEGKTRSVKSLHDRTCCRGQLSHTGQCSVSLSPS